MSHVGCGIHAVFPLYIVNSCIFQQYYCRSLHRYPFYKCWAPADFGKVSSAWEKILILSDIYYSYAVQNNILWPNGSV